MKDTSLEKSGRNSHWVAGRDEKISHAKHNIVDTTHPFIPQALRRMHAPHIS